MQRERERERHSCYPDIPESGSRHDRDDDVHGDRDVLTQFRQKKDPQDGSGKETGATTATSSLLAKKSS